MAGKITGAEHMSEIGVEAAQTDDVATDTADALVMIAVAPLPDIVVPCSSAMAG